MKKLLIVLTCSIAASCGNNSTEMSSDTAAIAPDTPANSTVIIDTAGLPSMNVDTTGMGAAR